MKQEITVTGKTVEEALASARSQISVEGAEMEYEIVDFPKKGFLGIGATPYVIKVTYNIPEEEPALAFVKSLLESLELDATVTAVDGEEGEMKISIDGEGAGLLIGHHGETLDSLQYLASLAGARSKSDDAGKRRIIVDIEGYREKRAETLRSLARRMSARVLKYKRSVTLEPMNPYERRIIHSEVQNIEGVTTHSIGTDADRRIVISLDRGERADQ